MCRLKEYRQFLGAPDWSVSVRDGCTCPTSAVCSSGIVTSIRSPCSAVSRSVRHSPIVATGKCANSRANARSWLPRTAVTLTCPARSQRVCSIHLRSATPGFGAYKVPEKDDLDRLQLGAGLHQLLLRASVGKRSQFAAPALCPAISEMNVGDNHRAGGGIQSAPEQCATKSVVRGTALLNTRLSQHPRVSIRCSVTTL
jgi:hypothetical protein